MYTIKLPRAFRGSRYGLDFTNGEATTDNAWLAKHLKYTAGITVIETVVPAEAADTWVPATRFPDAGSAVAENAGAQAAGENAQDPDAVQGGGGMAGFGDIGALRAEAAVLGIKVAHNAGAETIRRKIAEYKAAQGGEEAE